MADRAQMDRCLQALTVPRLRTAGFKGSLPHFRRITDVGGDLISFQFNRYGGSFVVEIARCQLGGIETAWGKLIPLGKAKAQDRHPLYRPRIADGKWFNFHEQQPATIATEVADMLLGNETWAGISSTGSERPYRQEAVRSDA